MSSDELISIIVPVFNAEQYIRRCLDSILNQTYRNIEVIVVDDGSTDNSSIICDEYAKLDNRIRVLHKTNGGAASARNIGIDNAKGLYIGFVDSDDYIAPDMYENLKKLLEEKNLAFIDSARKTVKNNSISEHTETNTLKICSGEEAIGHLLDWTGYCSLCTRLFRAEVFKDGFRIPVGRRVEDFIFCIRLFDKYGIEAYYDHSFYYVVSRKESVTHSSGGSIFLDALFYADEATDLVTKKYPALQEKAEFFRFYCIGQLFINSRQDEYYKDLEAFKQYFKYLRKHIGKALKNQYLSRTYKIVLLISCINFRIPAVLYKKKETK